MTFLFTGGGTGGHLFPAVAIAEDLFRQLPQAKIVFAGTKKGIEATVIPKTQFELCLISAVAFKRGVSLAAFFENLKFPFRLAKCISQAKNLLTKIKADVVIGTGGFVSFPVVWAAQTMGIPTIIQEQNSKAGWATRVLAYRASEIHLSFESSKRYFTRIDQRKVFLTGNPIRRFESLTRKLACEAFQLSPDKKTLLVFGGSLGARSINMAIEKHLDVLLSKVNIIWQTGKNDHEKLMKRISKKSNLWVNAFIERMDLAYAAADLVVCRAGASTMAELSALGLASILVPYPFATDNHQYFNAKAFSDEGAAVLIPDEEIISDHSLQMIINLLEDDSAREKMKTRSLTFAKPNAASRIALNAIKIASKA